MIDGARTGSRLHATRRWLARIRVRLLLINIVVVAVPLVGISFANMHERQLLAALERDMLHQAEIVRAVMAISPTAPPGDATLALAARDTRARIRLLDSQGTVIADSHRDGPPEGAERPAPHLLREATPARPPSVPKPVELATRPEIVRALAGRYGAATRLWEHADRVFLFVALPAPNGGVVYVTRSTRDVKLQLYELRAWLVKILIGALALTAFVTLLLATTIARPLGRLTRRAQRIAARQPVDDDADLTRRRDEIGQLARAVAAMTDELERRARDARTLAADLSHEFKTPLTGIRGAAELLRDGGADDDPDSRARFLAMILDDAARLDRLVSRLLELARVDDDRGTVLPVDLGALARAVAARPWPVPVTVAVDPDAFALVPGRGPAIAVAIENLVANATQHAQPATTVAIAIAGSGFAGPRSAAEGEREVSNTASTGALRIAVSNRGPALSDAARTRVWDRFYSTRVADGGSGLGLAIVRAVALAHHGAYGVDCADGTTTFWFDVTARS